MDSIAGKIIKKRVYESKLGELVEASKDIGSCFFNGNVQGIQKKLVRA